MNIVEQNRTTMTAICEINNKMRDQNEVNWEQRRYEIAKTVLPYCAETSRDLLMRGLSLGDSYKDMSMTQAVARQAVMFADDLINELKK